MCPFPKAGPRNFKRSNNRRKMKSAILIATPQKSRAHARRSSRKPVPKGNVFGKSRRSLQGKVWRFFQEFSSRRRMGEMYFLHCECTDGSKSYADVDPNNKNFLSCIGANTYGLANKLFSTSELAAVTFEHVVQKLGEHYKESLHEPAASYGFYQCKMKPSQSHSDLRGCDFGAAFDRIIRDIIVINTTHDKVRRACLRESSPTRESVLKTANSYVTLKQTFRQYPAIHTNCSLSNCTISN